MRRVLSIKRSSSYSKVTNMDLAQRLKQCDKMQKIKDNLNSDVFKKNNDVDLEKKSKKTVVDSEPKSMIKNSSTTLRDAKDIYVHNKSFIETTKRSGYEQDDQNKIYLLNSKRSVDSLKKPSYVINNKQRRSNSFAVKNNYHANKFNTTNSRHNGHNVNSGNRLNKDFNNVNRQRNSGTLGLGGGNRTNLYRTNNKPFFGNKTVGGNKLLRPNTGSTFNKVNNVNSINRFSQGGVNNTAVRAPMRPPYRTAGTAFVSSNNLNVTPNTRNNINRKTSAQSTYNKKSKKDGYYAKKSTIKKPTDANFSFSRVKKIKRKADKTKRKLTITWDYDLNYLELASLMNMDKDAVLKVLQEIDDTVKKDTLLKSDIVELAVEECGHIPNYVVAKDNIDYYWPKKKFPAAGGDDEQDDKEQDKMELKNPVIAFYGHVDHGKTSLIKNCINANFLTKEYGGMSQNITGYNLDGFGIIDTPGHAILDMMRQEVIQMIDIAVLVIAGNEGIKEQTEECLNHIMKNKKKLIVLINKVDLCLPEDIEKIREDLLERDIDVVSEVPFLEVSATKDKGFMKKLLKEIDKFKPDIKCVKSKYALGYVLDSQVDARQGVKTTIMIAAGELKCKDIVATPSVHGRIKAINNYANQKMKSAKPGEIVTVLGFKEIAKIGERFVVVENDKLAVDIAAVKSKTAIDDSYEEKNTLEDLFSDLDKEEYKFIIKGFNHAVLDALEKGIDEIKSEKYNIVIATKGVGGVTETDINIIGRDGVIYCLQQKKIDKHILALAKQNNITIKNFDIIFDLLKDIRSVVIEDEDGAVESKNVGMLKLLKIFVLSDKKTTVAGCRVTSGFIHRRHRAVVLRDKKEMFAGNILSIKVEKDDLDEVTNGKECGILLKGFNDFKEGDVIKTYEQK